MVRFPQVSLQQALSTAFEQAVGSLVKRMGLRRRTGRAEKTARMTS
jgi:hypothetical protein